MVGILKWILYGITKSWGNLWPSPLIRSSGWVLGNLWPYSDQVCAWKMAVDAMVIACFLHCPPL